MHLLWPWDQARAVDDRELEHLYRYPAGPRWLAVNYVASADGAVEAGGRAARLSNAPDRKILQLGSDLADVLLVGARTAIIEKFEGVHPSDETLRRRRRHGLHHIPPTAVVTSGRTLPPDAPVITKALVPTIVITCEAAPLDKRGAWAEAGAEVLVAGRQTVDIAAAVRALVERGLGRIDCEGGPILFGSLIKAGVVDELRLTVSPLLVSGAAGRIATGVPVQPVDLELVSLLAEDGVILLRYLIRR